MVAASGWGSQGLRGQPWWRKALSHTAALGTGMRTFPPESASRKLLFRTGHGSERHSDRPLCLMTKPLCSQITKSSIDRQKALAHPHQQPHRLSFLGCCHVPQPGPPLKSPSPQASPWRWSTSLKHPSRGCCSAPAGSTVLGMGSGNRNASSRAGDTEWDGADLCRSQSHQRSRPERDVAQSSTAAGC